jgi:hypothetical protein
MAEMKHTPGKWEAKNVDDTGGPYFYYEPGGNRVEVPGWMVYGPKSLGNGECGANTEADARMMAAAPDLYEALCDLVDCNDRWNAAVKELMPAPPDWNGSYLDAARAALAKAQGKEGPP